VSSGAHALDPIDDGLDLLLGGRRFHHDHHQLSSLVPGNDTKANGTGFTRPGGFSALGSAMMFAR
jgi:hypothetical protein